MQRLALLIGAPGREGFPGFLPGVAQDIANYRRFLRSATGGAWTDQEIPRIPLNPNIPQLLRFVKNARPDYVLVVFSGHGAMDPATGEQLVSLQPQQLMRLHSLVPAARWGVVIADACRRYQPTGLSGVLGEALQPFRSALPPVVARQLFEEQLLACAPGWTTLLACQPDKLAHDTDNGGIFSTTLLQSVNGWVQAPGPMHCWSVTDAFQQTEHALVRQQPFRQQPQIRFSPGQAHQLQQLPFALRMPQHVL